MNFMSFEPRNEELNEVGKIIAAKDAPLQSRKESLKKKNNACRDANPDLVNTCAAL